MIENRKWFKGCRDRGLNTINFRHGNYVNEEKSKKYSLIKLRRNEENLIAS